MFRLMVILANCAVCIFLAGIVAQNPRAGSLRDWTAVGVLFGTCAMSAFYILYFTGQARVPKPSKPSRLRGLVNLWLTAKEEELRRRAQPRDQNSN